MEFLLWFGKTRRRPNKDARSAAQSLWGSIQLFLDDTEALAVRIFENGVIRMVLIPPVDRQCPKL